MIAFVVGTLRRLHKQHLIYRSIEEISYYLSHPHSFYSKGTYLARSSYRMSSEPPQLSNKKKKKYGQIERSLEWFFREGYKTPEYEKAFKNGGISAVDLIKSTKFPTSDINEVFDVVKNHSGDKYVWELNEAGRACIYPTSSNTANSTPATTTSNQTKVVEQTKTSEVQVVSAGGQNLPSPDIGGLPENRLEGNQEYAPQVSGQYVSSQDTSRPTQVPDQPKTANTNNQDNWRNKDPRDSRDQGQGNKQSYQQGQGNQQSYQQGQGNQQSYQQGKGKKKGKFRDANELIGNQDKRWQQDSGAGGYTPAYKDQDGRGHSRSDKGEMKDPTHLSRLLSMILRHKAVEMGFDVKPGGYIKIKDILKRGNFKSKDYTFDDVKKMCEENDKKRYTIKIVDNEAYICANQGHSFEVPDMESTLVEIQSPAELESCIHGTYQYNWDFIKTQGLHTSGRVHIHFATGLLGENGVVSGMRKSCEVAIFIDLAKAMADGIKFWRSANNVILSPGDKDGYILPKYFSSVVWVGSGSRHQMSLD